MAESLCQRYVNRIAVLVNNQLLMNINRQFVAFARDMRRVLVHLVSRILTAGVKISSRPRRRAIYVMAVIYVCVDIPKRYAVEQDVFTHSYVVSPKVVIVFLVAGGIPLIERDIECQQFSSFARYRCFCNRKIFVRNCILFVDKQTVRKFKKRRIFFYFVNNTRRVCIGRELTTSKDFNLAYALLCIHIINPAGPSSREGIASAPYVEESFRRLATRPKRTHLNTVNQDIVKEVDALQKSIVTKRCCISTSVIRFAEIEGKELVTILNGCIATSTISLHNLGVFNLEVVGRNARLTDIFIGLTKRVGFENNVICYTELISIRFVEEIFGNSNLFDIRRCQVAVGNIHINRITS